jgi:hypothetical protein
MSRKRQRISLVVIYEYMNKLIEKLNIINCTDKLFMIEIMNKSKEEIRKR